MTDSTTVVKEILNTIVDKVATQDEDIDVWDDKEPVGSSKIKSSKSVKDGGKVDVFDDILDLYEENDKPKEVIPEKPKVEQPKIEKPKVTNSKTAKKLANKQIKNINIDYDDNYDDDYDDDYYYDEEECEEYDEYDEYY